MARSSSSSRSSSPSRSSSRSSSPTRSSSLSSKTSSSNSAHTNAPSVPSVSPVPVQTKPSVMQDIMTTAAGVATGNFISNVLLGSSKKEDSEKTKVVHVYEPYPQNTQKADSLSEKNKCYEEFEKYTKCVESEFNDCTILFTEFKKCFHKESE